MQNSSIMTGGNKRTTRVRQDVLGGEGADEVDATKASMGNLEL